MNILKKIFFRSFMLQALWNYERMQNVGFLYSILPKLEELYGDDKEKLKESCKRHTTYFNTHPYMAPIILGFAAKQEEAIKNKKKGAVEELNRFKLQMAGPLAAIGDKAFWSTWRPLVGLVGVMGVLLNVRPNYLIPLVFILLYNFPIIFHRYKVLKLAYYEPLSIHEKIKKSYNHFVSKVVPTIGLFLIGVCLINAVIRLGLIRGLIFAAVTVSAIILRTNFRVTATKILYIVSGLIIVIGVLIK